MIESPCINSCIFDKKTDLCVGCGRNSEEISNWLYYSDNQKEKVLKGLKSRNKILIRLQKKRLA